MTTTEDDAPKKIKVDYYVDLVLRRRWLLIISFCLAMISGMYLSITLPKIYSADTLILIEPKGIPDKYVESLTETPVQDRVSTITEQIRSRTYLEKIINDTELYSEHKKMILEEKIALMRKKMKIQVTRGRKGADAFKISFEGKAPEKITAAVNALAGFFIDESIAVMRAEIDGAIGFLQDELRQKEEKLLKVENNLKEYRTEHMGGLPDQLRSNLSMLEGVRKQLTEKQESLRDEKIRMIQLDAQMTDVRREMENYVPPPDFVSPEDMPSIKSDPKREPENVIQLRRLREQYAALSAKYTSRHPDVIKLNEMVANLEKKLLEEAKNAPPEEPKPDPNLRKKSRAELIAANYRAAKENQLKEIRVQYDESRLAIKRHEEDMAKLLAQMTIYERRVEDTPKREQEMMSLTRDYKNIQSSYNDLLERKLDADMAVSMERKSKGQRFRVLDPAKVPVKPFSPNLMILLAISIGAGIGVGGGLIFLLDLLDTSLRRPEDIESLVEIPVLATVPGIHYRPIDKIKKQLEHVLTAIFIGIDLSLFVLFALLVLKGMDFLKKLVPSPLARILFFT